MQTQWYPFSELDQVYMPLGTVGILGAFRQGHSYNPLFAFPQGFAEMSGGVETIWNKVIKNHNQIYRGFLEANMHIRLGVSQRLALLALSILNIFRGVITFCFLGFLFYPLDRIYDHLNQPSISRYRERPGIPGTKIS